MQKRRGEEGWEMEGGGRGREEGGDFSRWSKWHLVY